MDDFGYLKVMDERAALAALQAPTAVAIAGGTELLNWMRLGIARPAQLVDISGLPGRDGIALDGSSLTIGSAATLAFVGEHPLVNEHAAALGQACLLAASAQVRNRATLGGNVLQRTRCPYFRAEEPLLWPCNKRSPGSGCAARHGLNEQHAILGWTDDCVATQPSDPLVALVCLDAQVEVAGPDGQRRLAVADLHLTQQEAAAQGLDPARGENRLEPGELIVGYRIPLATGMTSAYVKVRERVSYAYAVVSAAAAVRLDGPVVGAVRITLGSVAQRPWTLPGAAHELVGKPLSEDAVMAGVRTDLSDARPLSGNGYKIELARAVAVRAVMAAVN